MYYGYTSPNPTPVYIYMDYGYTSPNPTPVYMYSYYGFGYTSLAMLPCSKTKG